MHNEEIYSLYNKPKTYYIYHQTDSCHLEMVNSSCSIKVGVKMFIIIPYDLVTFVFLNTHLEVGFMSLNIGLIITRKNGG